MVEKSLVSLLSDVKIIMNPILARVKNVRQITSIFQVLALLLKVVTMNRKDTSNIYDFTIV